MLTLAVEKPDAANHGIFNCVSDRAVTLDGMAKLCAQAAGRPANIVHYDPKAVGIDAKKAFPFRNMVIAYLQIYPKTYGMTHKYKYRMSRLTQIIKLINSTGWVPPC